MIALANTPSFFVPASPAYSGTSTGALFVNDAIRRSFQEWQSTASRRLRIDGLQQQLLSIISECVVQSWDGYSARPLTPMAIDEARRFLAVIPDRLLPNEIVPEPHGGIAFVWNGQQSRSLALSLNGTKTIEYAAIYGPVDQDSGRRSFAGLLPSFILELISKFR